MKIKEIFSAKNKALFLLTIYAFSLSSCHFYKGREVDTTLENASTVAKNDGKTVYYVLHVGESVWGLSNIYTTKSGIKGTLTQVDKDAMAYYNNFIEYGTLRFPAADHIKIYQAHIFANEFKKDGDEVSVSNDEITKLYVLDKNKKKSAGATGGIVAGSIVGGLGVFLLIACNCPHVYVYDGDTYYYNNTLFTGATSPVIERSDYKGMPDYFPSSTEYKLKIVNEDNEIQKIDHLQLMVVEHDANSEIIADQLGRVYEIKDLAFPISASDDGQESLMNSVAYHDGESYDFDNKTSENFSNLYVNFKAPLNNTNTHLVLRAKNSLWLSYVYKSFTELFGKHYEKWVKKNHKKSKKEVYEALKKEGIPLVVSIKNGDEWIDVESIQPVGDVNFNSIIVPIDPTLIQEDDIQIRLSSGFMFWNIDQIAIDYTPESELKVERIHANEINEISADDEQYLVLEKNDSVTLNFSGLSTSENLKRTIILESNGHYLPLMSHEGKANKKELAKFKGGGEMSKFSRRLYFDNFGDMEITFNQ